VAQRVGMNLLGEVRAARGGVAGMPDGFGGDRLSGESALEAGEQPRGARLRAPTPVGAELSEESEAERYVAVLAALALADVDHHASAVDVLRLQAADLRAAHAGGVEGHEDGAVVEVGGMFDESRGLLGAEHGRQGAGSLGQGQVVTPERAFEDLEIKEAERAHLHHDGMGLQSAFLEEMYLILANVFDTKPLWRTMEELGELPDGTDVGTCGSLRVITALEFLEHPFA